MLALDWNNSYQAAAPAGWSFPSSWQKERKANFTLSAVCSGATEPQHWYAADTTSQHAISLSSSPSLCKPVNSSTTTIIKAFWLITPFNWTILAARAKWRLVSSAAEQSERTNKQANKWGYKQTPWKLTWNAEHGKKRRRGWPANTETCRNIL